MLRWCCPCVCRCLADTPLVSFRFPGHFLSLHFFLWMVSGQALPPNCGSSLTIRVRMVCPFPQDLLHSDHSDHSETMQSIASNKKKNTWSIKEQRRRHFWHLVFWCIIHSYILNMCLTIKGHLLPLTAIFNECSWQQFTICKSVWHSKHASWCSMWRTAFHFSKNLTAI